METCSDSQILPEVCSICSKLVQHFNATMVFPLKRLVWKRWITWVQLCYVLLHLMFWFYCPYLTVVLYSQHSRQHRFLTFGDWLVSTGERLAAKQPDISPQEYVEATTNKKCDGVWVNVGFAFIRRTETNEKQKLMNVICCSVTAECVNGETIGKISTLYGDDMIVFTACVHRP